jgi:hypothetical protein
MWRLLEKILFIHCLRDTQEYKTEDCSWCYHKSLDRRRLPSDTVLRTPLELARN